MRKSLYQRNYTLLKKFVPEMLEDMPPTFALLHIGLFDPRVKTYAERYDETCLVRVGTDWPINGERSCDPLFDVMFDNKLKMARVKFWGMENLMFQYKNGGPIFKVFDCTFDSEETEREREANDFLYDWLKGIAKDRQSNPDYFQKLPVDW